MTVDQEEPTLPPYPAEAGDERMLPLNKRKRSIASQLFSDSSEPAIFSSDDDPDAENYQNGQGRHKRQYVGLWDRQQPVIEAESSVAREKRKFERQVDSGVFLGSDASTDSILDDLPPPPAASRLPGSQFVQVPRSSQTPSLSHAEAAAQRAIQQCIDTGNETIDLSGMQLETISNATISRLSEVVRIPKVEEDVPFEHQDPQLKLFLFNNSLTRVPGAIFNMDHITVLSLRGNLLTELPPSIFKMRNLEELNVSQNSLKSVPWDLLMLIYHSRHLRTLSLHPNPFYRPQFTEHMDSSPCPPRTRPREGQINRLLGASWDQMELSNGGYNMLNYGRKFQAEYRARTPVQFSDSQGTTYGPFRIDPDATHLPTEDIEAEPLLPRGRAPSSSAPLKPKPTKVLSLVELTLQACYREELPPSEWRGYWDKYWRDSKFAKTGGRELIDLLEEMHMQREAGGQQCGVCRRLIIKPIAQWIEWWELRFARSDPNPFTPNIGRLDGPVPLEPSPPPSPPEDPLSHEHAEQLVPFWRRACSWECAMDPVKGLGKQQGETSANSSFGAGPASRTQL